jgi:hypothetical protein
MPRRHIPEERSRLAAALTQRLEREKAPQSGALTDKTCGKVDLMRNGTATFIWNLYFLPMNDDALAPPIQPAFLMDVNAVVYMRLI